jgi:hypothetical protein
MRIPCFFLSFAIATVIAMADLIVIVVQVIVNDFHLFGNSPSPSFLFCFIY